MRLISINNSRGLWNLTEGGVGYNFFRIMFAGNGTGSGYEFRVELFEGEQDSGPNGGTIASLSMILMIFIAFTSFFSSFHFQ